MPYRIKEGQEVLLVMSDGTHKKTFFKRTVDFIKAEIVSSPLSEHHNEGYAHKPLNGKSWGFDVIGKWTKGSLAKKVKYLYAETVFTVDKYTSKNEEIVIVKGSKSNQYTVTLDSSGFPVRCSCPAFRFRKEKCKHMKSLDLPF